MTVQAFDLPDLLDDVGSPRDLASLGFGHMLPSDESPAENAALLGSRGTRGLDSSAVFKPVNLERKRDHMDLPPTTPPTRSSSSAAQRPSETPKSNKACAQGTSAGAKRTFGFIGDDKAGSESHATQDAAPASSTRPSRQCKDLSLKRIRQAVQDSPIDDDEEDSDPSMRSDRRASSRDTDFHARLPSMSSADREKVALETRHKGPCSYEQCPNPTHSSGGGFKFVTEDTKAGSRDWSPYWGRVFCNACFTQYATRGTLQRPGRFLVPPTPTVPSTIVPPRVITPEPSANALRPTRSAAASVPVPPTPPSPSCEEDVPTVVEDDLGGADESMAIVELELVASGDNLRFQWMRDGRLIPGAVTRTLIIRNPAQCAGDFTCKVVNECGAAPPFVPVRMPITLSDAKVRYATRSTREDILSCAKIFRLTCKCGSVREGEPALLCEPCAECGLEVCGTVEPVHTKEQAPGAKAQEECGWAV